MLTLEEKRARQREYSKRYRETHKEKIAAYQREYSKRYRETHKEEIAAYMKHWNETHKEEKAAYQKKWIAENKDKHKEYMRKYMNEYYAKHGAFMYPKRPWEDWEIELVLEHSLTNAELSPIIQRSANAIHAKRAELKKQLETFGLSWK